MNKNTYKTITVEDLNKSIKTLKANTIKKYKEQYDKAKLKLQEITKEREESRNVMHDVGLKNKIDIQEAKMKAIKFSLLQQDWKNALSR